MTARKPGPFTGKFVRGLRADELAAAEDGAVHAAMHVEDIDHDDEFGGEPAYDISLLTARERQAVEDALRADEGVPDDDPTPHVMRLGSQPRKSQVWRS